MARSYAATAALIASLVAFSLPGEAAAQQSSSPTWWTPAYVVDYGLIAAGGASYLLASRFAPRDRAIFGPRYDAADPTAVLEPQYADRIGRLHVEEGTGETVPVPHLIGIAAAMGGAIALQEGLLWATTSRGSAQLLHDSFVGYLEATALTGGATEIAKTFVGRLRPDFQDRATRHLCNTTPPDGLDCTAFVGRPLDEDAEEAEHIFEDGRKSFWSGHSSFAFSTFTYATLITGGRWVWGADATPTSRALGLLAQMAFMSSAAFIAGSRLDDGRHHVTDVVVGSVVGFGLASFSYWRRFDSDGRLHRAKSSTQDVTMRTTLDPGPGFGLSLTFQH